MARMRSACLLPTVSDFQAETSPSRLRRAALHRWCAVSRARMNEGMTVQLFSAGLEKASERPKSASHNEFDHYTIEPPAPLGGTKKAAHPCG